MTAITSIQQTRQQEVQAILQRDGVLTPGAVVEYASDPSTALHSMFEWNDNEAARKFRLLQAAGYLRVLVKVLPVNNGDPVRVRAFVTLPSERGRSLYRPVVEVLENPDQRAEVLEAALRDWNAFRERYRHLQELSEFFALVEEAIQAV